MYTPASTMEFLITQFSPTNTSLKMTEFSTLPLTMQPLETSEFLTSHPGLYFAGQMTGVEGYVESAASGMVAGICAAMQQLGRPLPDFPRETALGALAHYVAAENRNFQPMNVTFGIMEGWPERVRGGKQARYEKIAQRALEKVDQLRREMDLH